MKKIDFQELSPGIKKNILLKNYTTFKIGGPAQYFFTTQTKEDLIKAILAAKKFKLSFFVLGEGSNLLVSDKGFKGLLIKLQVSGYKLQENKIYVKAGVLLIQLVNTALKNNLTGLEWAAGIPGTIGGAVRGNAGAFEKSMADIVKEVEVLDFKTLKIKKLKNRDCKFNYRDSIFKRNKNLIILAVEFQFKKEKKSEIQKKIKKYLNYKKDAQPLNFFSAGSIFKNPSSTQVLKKFKQASDSSAGKLIEECGLKGKKIGDVKISEKHANFIVNLGNGKAKDVIKLIKLIKKEVKEKFGIVLEEEIQYLGF